MPTTVSTRSASNAPTAAAANDVAQLAQRFARVRAQTLALAAPLSAEDAMVQSMPDASPAKWHLAHTTWFFERFVLGSDPDYTPVRAEWDFLFNSYYQSAGPMHARPSRGVLSRPTLAEVLAYRHEVDARIARRVEQGSVDNDALRVLELGTHHEQQHQELLLTDLKHAFFCNPIAPAYREDLAAPPPTADAMPLRWVPRDEWIGEIGAHAWPAAARFAFDGESPRHRVLVPAHALASRPVSNAEYGEFIADGGYRKPGLWLSDGWSLVQAQGLHRPLYWHPDGAREFTLAGWRQRDPHAPACHLSYFEADAYARWAGARLPTEAEWEAAAAGVAVDGNLLERALLHPCATSGDGPGLRQLFGDVWEWTSSAYTPYPGFRPLAGTLGEYNGKFMSGQSVLRGGSCATAGDHVHASYRNFFPPPARWQFSGLRLARDPA